MEKVINNLVVFIEGDSKAKSILFVHGYPYDHKMWDNQVNELGKNYYCVTYDIKGLGRSSPSDGQFTIESFVDDLEKIIDELDLDKPILCGLSMGGYISLRAVERMENKFSGLILCDTKSSADDDAGKLKRAAGIKAINDEGTDKFVEQFVRNCFAEKFIKEKETEYLDVLNRSKQNSAVGLKGCLLAMAARTDTTDYLPKISIPTLIICGKEDKLTPSNVMKTMAEQIKNSNFVLIENAGHMTPIEKPAEVNKAMKEFLAHNHLV